MPAVAQDVYVILRYCSKKNPSPHCSDDSDTWKQGELVIVMTFSKIISSGLETTLKTPSF